MSSSQSHFRRHPDRNDTAAQDPKSNSRVPTKNAAGEHGKPSKAVQNVLKLAKKSSRSMTHSEPTKSSTTRTATPATAVTQNVNSSGGRISVTPSGVTQALAPPNLRTPSLVSGSSISTFDSPRSALRRKPSGAIDKYAAQKRSNMADCVNGVPTAIHVHDQAGRDVFEDTVLGITIPPSNAYEQDPAGVPHGYHGPEMMRDFTPPVPSLYAPSATPSTRYTESPFSHVPTPSSASSYSPGLVSTSESGSRARQGSATSLTRKPTTGQTAQGDGLRPGLQPVREDSTSASNATFRQGNKLSKQRPHKQSVASAASVSTKVKDVQRSPPQGQQSTNSTTKQYPAVPPELAHLNVDLSTAKSPPQKSALPVRPSRDNTPNIPGMRGASPVIQSDLPRLYTTYHKRTPSQETPVSPSSSSFKSRFGFSSRSSSRNESPRIDSAISPSPASRRFHRGQTPEIPSAEGTNLQRKDSPALAQGTSPAKTSRFGIFHRKSKDAKLAEKPKRQSLKGPAAGTGHEGYGRFGARGRSGSGASSAGFRSPSTDSGTSSMAPTARPPPPRRMTSSGSKEEPILDDFLAQRLKPVILRGSGSTFSNTPSSSDLRESRLQPASSKSSSLDSYPRPRLLPSAMRQGSQSPTKRGSFGRRRPSDSSEDDVAARYPILAARRSLARTSSVGSKSQVRVPPLIDTTVPPHQASLHSYDAELTAWPQTDSSLPSNEDAFHGKEGLWLRSPPAESSFRPAKKLNFFQRMATPRSKGKERELQHPSMPEHAAHQSPYRAVAHYAMASSVESIGLDEVERIAQENETSAEDSMSEHRPSKVVPYEGRHFSLLPSPPTRSHSEDSDFSSKHILPKIMVQRQESTESPEILRAQSAFQHQTAQVVNMPKSSDKYHAGIMDAQRSEPANAAAPRGSSDVGRDSLNTPEMTGDSQRQPRLSPVGRIPAVVSKRDRDRKPSDISFSRPFARTQPRPSVKPPGSVYSQIREMASTIESGSQPISSSSTATSAEQKESTFTDPPSISTARTSVDLHNIGSELFASQDRKNSEQSNLFYSTSSGNPSWMPALHTQAPEKEDVWNEYDDFMDEHMPLKTPTLKTPTTGSSLGAPFQYSSMLFDGDNGALVTPALYQSPPYGRLPPPPGLAETITTVLTVPQQVSRFLQPSVSPLATPDTLYGLIGGYGNRSTSTLFTQDRTSTPEGPSVQQLPRSNLRDSMASSIYSRGSDHSRTSSLPEGTQRHSQSSLIPGPRNNSDAQLRAIAEMPGGDRQGASSSLRIGALMTSKWLSFGRVLFSPAHNEVRFAEDPRVLVVDGLSSDWSYYIAMSYPDAKVYNMTPSMPGSPSFSWPDEDQVPPPNHHQIPMVNIATPFPFPKGFFKAVVFRFPPATTEQSYAACISESKRVLQPGGYLECAVLDLDLINMGTKARGAVRGLKTRMQHRDPQVCLRNLSDILVRMMGRRGFDAVQCCIVGVPAAGRIPRSQDMSSVESDSSGKAIWQREARSGKSQEPKFSDLLEDAGKSQFGKNNDEIITKMVAKVGRFWYSSCYEKPLLPADQSIWSDPKLLRECERQGTSFRLLICHAQKPLQTRRRTVSV